jgi:hypothetical protein
VLPAIGCNARTDASTRSENSTKPRSRSLSLFLLTKSL